MTASNIADRYIDEQIARLGPVAPAPPIGKMLACDLRCHQATLEQWIRRHRGDDIPAVMDAFASAIGVIERHLIP